MGGAGTTGPPAGDCSGMAHEGKTAPKIVINSSVCSEKKYHQQILKFTAKISRIKKLA